MCHPVVHVVWLQLNRMCILDECNINSNLLSGHDANDVYYRVNFNKICFHKVNHCLWGICSTNMWSCNCINIIIQYCNSNFYRILIQHTPSFILTTPFHMRSKRMFGSALNFFQYLKNVCTLPALHSMFSFSHWAHHPVKAKFLCV